MSEFKAKKITSINTIDFNKLTSWMQNWWGKEELWSFEKTTQYMNYSFNKNKLPFTIVAFNENNEEVAMCQVTMHDLEVRPDIYPYIANLYVEPKFRGQGLVKILLDKALSEAKKMNINELYIYTAHVGLYEKYGWKFVEKVDTYLSPRIQSIYKIKF